LNIYEFLKSNLEVKTYRIPISVFSDELKEVLITDNDKSLFDLIKNISSLALKLLDSGAEFWPMMVIEGRRTFSVEDLKEDDYTLLRSIDLSKIPLNLRARIADILWLEKKDYKNALKCQKRLKPIVDGLYMFEDNGEPQKVEAKIKEINTLMEATRGET